MEGYKATIESASKELTVKEKIMLKDTSDAIKLDDVVKEEAIIISPDYYAIVAIHNEKSDTKDYKKIVIVDKLTGEKYTTGSMPFITTFEDIVEEMEDAGEVDYSIKIYPKLFQFFFWFCEEVSCRIFNLWYRSIHY